MKKNLVPLLGIAFVVAIATTGIFYGLFVGKLGASAPTPVVVAAKDLKPGFAIRADQVKVTPWTSSSMPAGYFTSADQVVGRTLTHAVAEGEPVLTAGMNTLAAGGAQLQPNQRAVSTHVTDSVGVLEMLHAGDHVDVQVLSVRDKGEAEIRTILQNKVVLGIHGAPEATSHTAAAAPVVTLLVDMNEAEALALADSTARVRLSLRNPGDSGRNRNAGLGFMSLLHNGSPRPETAPIEGASSEPVVESPKASAAAAVPDVQLQVQIFGAAPSALDELFRMANSSGRPDLFQASAVNRSGDLAATIKHLEEQKNLEILSTSQVRTGVGSSVILQAGKGDPHAGVRIRFSPMRSTDGRLRLQIEPEVTTPDSVRKLDTKIEVANGQPFLLGGLVQAKERAAVLDKFFGGRELVVVVTPRTN